MRTSDPATIFLWLLTLTVIVALYFYRLNVFVTVLLVILCSLFLGLLVFALVTEVDTGDPDWEWSEPDQSPNVADAVPARS